MTRDTGGTRRETKVQLGTFTPPANATDEQLDEWAVLLADEIAERLKNPPTEPEPVESPSRPDAP